MLRTGALRTAAGSSPRHDRQHRRPVAVLPLPAPCRCTACQICQLDSRVHAFAIPRSTGVTSGSMNAGLSWSASATARCANRADGLQTAASASAELTADPASSVAPLTLRFRAAGPLLSGAQRLRNATVECSITVSMRRIVRVTAFGGDRGFACTVMSLPSAIAKRIAYAIADQPRPRQPFQPACRTSLRSFINVKVRE